MGMEAVIKSFEPAMMDLARRASQGDENVPVCLIGYMGANRMIANELQELYDTCAEKVAREQSVAA